MRRRRERWYHGREGGSTNIFWQRARFHGRSRTLRPDHRILTTSQAVTTAALDSHHRLVSLPQPRIVTTTALSTIMTGHTGLVERVISRIYYCFCCVFDGALNFDDVHCTNGGL